MTEPTNDNHVGNPDAELREPDSHGQAAMLLVESLIHGLIARSVITTQDAVEIVEIAAAVKTEIADDLGDSPANLRKSLSILSSLRRSLETDVSSA